MRSRVAGTGAFLSAVRLFVAVWPSAEVVATLRGLPRPVVPKLRWTTEDQWHVTLRFLGDVPEEAGRAVLAEVRFGSRPRAVMGPEVGRSGDQLVHVPVAGLEALAAAVEEAAVAVGGPPAARRFWGHLTLGRANRRRADLRRLAGTPVDGAWDVGEVTLVASALHPQGARYSVVARVPLPTP